MRGGGRGAGSRDGGVGGWHTGRRSGKAGAWAITRKKSTGRIAPSACSPCCAPWRNASVSSTGRVGCSSACRSCRSSWGPRAARCYTMRCGSPTTRRRLPRAAGSWRRRSGSPARLGVREARGAGGVTSRTTRTTNRGGGSVTHEGVLRAAGGGGSGRGGGAVVRVAAAAGAAPERAASRRRGGRVPRLHAGLRRGAGRSHRVLRLRVPLLRFVRDGADAGDPRTVARHGQIGRAHV